MKLRIQGDSIRLRLRKPDIRELLEHGVVIERTAFGLGSELRTRLNVGGDQIIAWFSSGEITVRVPRELFTSWACSDQVGIGADQPVGERTLRILIEKDFACIDPGSDESQEGAFENPDRAMC